MAISDVADFTHLREIDVEALAQELDTIRCDVEDSRGEGDRAYVGRVIAGQRGLDVAARLLIALSRRRLGWLLGTAALAAAKSVENMELGHNIGHGQWDWMNDPEIHSATWEWDMAAPSSQWRYSHNYRHHVFTNVLGMDDDLGYGIMRVTPDQPWTPGTLLQPLRHLVLALTFEWGIALQGLDAARDRMATPQERSAAIRVLLVKVARQAAKDYLLLPALGARRWRRVLYANAVANLARNVWAYLVINCGHFPDGAETFTPATLVGETKPQWYLRQLLGSANFRAGPVLALLSGHLCYQIAHHLYPDLPSNRYARIAPRVRALCTTYRLPYTTGSLSGQYLQSLRTIHALALPNRVRRDTHDDTPQTALESAFEAGTGPVTGVGDGAGHLRRATLPVAPRGHGRRRTPRFDPDIRSRCADTARTVRAGVLG
jgi:fatty acid desaturase